MKRSGPNAVEAPDSPAAVHREIDPQRLIGSSPAFDANVARLVRVAAIGDMLADIAHEMNQPLFIIQNYAQATISSLTNSGQIDRDSLLSFARQIAIAIEGAGRFANQVRQFGSKSEPSPAYNDVGEIVDSAIVLVGSDLRRRRIAVQTDFAEGATRIFADRGLIVEVLVFLLKNACEACDALPIAEGQITVRTRMDDECIRISVLDQGIGLPEVDSSTLFEPFYTTKVDKLGIGLSVSRSIVEAARGRLWAEANSPRGSILHFTLPRGPEVTVGK